MFESEFRKRIKGLSYVRLLDRSGKFKLPLVTLVFFAIFLGIVIEYSPRSILISVGTLGAAIFCMANYSVFNSFKDPVFHRAKKYFAAFAIAFVCVFLTGLILNSIKVHRSKAIARPVVSAIKDYSRKHKAFPDSLEMLIPEYFEEVPRSAMGWSGHEFRYKTSGTNTFYLIIPHGGGRFDWVFDSERGQWLEGS